MTKQEKGKNMYFENENRDKNTDFTEVIELDSTLKNIEKESIENMTDTQREYYRKIDSLIAYREQIYLSHIESMQQKSYIDFNKNLINYCRTMCMDINKDDFSMDEKKCLKNCSIKYVQQLKIFNKFRPEYDAKFGSTSFLFDETEIKAMDKMFELMKIDNDNL